MGVPAVRTSPGSAVRVTTVPSNGALDGQVVAVGFCFLQGRARVLLVGDGAGDVRFLLGDLAADHGCLHAADIGIAEGRLGRRQSPAGGFHAAFGSGDQRGLRLGGSFRLLALTFGHRARLRQLGVGVFIEDGQLIGRFLLRQFGLRRRQFAPAPG